MPMIFTFVVIFLCLGSNMAGRILLSLYALELGAKPADIGLLAASFYVFPFVLSWWLGKLSDRYGSRWLIFWGTLCGALGMLAPYFWREIPAMYLGGLMLGIAFATFNGMLQTIVGQLSKPEQRTRNFSNMSLLGSTMNFVAPMWAGFSIDHLGAAPACLYVMAVSIAGGVLVLGWGGCWPGGSERVESAGRFADILKQPGVVRMLVASTVVQVCQDLFLFYMPVHGHQVGLSATVIGVVLSAYAAACWLVRMVLMRLVGRLGEGGVLVYAFAIAAMSLVAMPLFGHPVALGALAFVFGLGMGCGQPIVTVMLFSNSAEGRSGETFGVRLTINNMMRFTTPVLFGVVASAFGLFPLFLLNALMMAAGSALMARGRGGRAPRQDPE